MNFGENLMRMRKRKGFSQEDLAFSIDVSRQTIYSWEAELNYPNVVMLKKIADALGVTTDDLISGYDVSQLPNGLDKIEVRFLKKHDEDVYYNELPNWFVKLSIGDDVSFALYDDGKRDYGYHLHIANKVILHEEECLEVIVDEFDSHLTHEKTYTSFVQTKDNEVSFVGRVYQKDGIKHIETFKDKDYLKDWGMGGQNIGQSMIYHNAEDCVLTYAGKRIDVIKISYFDPDGTEDGNKVYFETFLNSKGESVYWRRYNKGSKSKAKIEINNNEYGLGYECITDRLLKI